MQWAAGCACQLMNILFASSEMTPYAKTGGLGDVLAALPAALRGAGHSVSVVLPLYADLRRALPGLKPSELVLKVGIGPLKFQSRVGTGWREWGEFVCGGEG
ncbi:MAG: glycogen/starch synthase [Blastochloris sp.]|nr:glycogen/starch synthase [Blastochloris sp.]